MEDLDETSESVDVEDEKVKSIIEKSLGVTQKGFGPLPRKYLPFPDDKFGIWTDEEHFYIGDSTVVVDGSDLLIGGERYEGTHALLRLMTNPNKKKLNKEEYEGWWTSEENFTKKDVNIYKEIMKMTHSIYRNNDPSTKKP